MKQKTGNENGQIALIALLVLTLATTVGLSLIGRSTTDVSVTRTIEESTRAFSAAEAGIEATLKSGVASSGTIDPALGLSYNVTVASVNATAGSPYMFAQKTPQENTETVWLVDHGSDGSITEAVTYSAPSIDVCWSQESPVQSAVIATILYKESSDGSYRTAKAAYDSDASRALANNFASPVASSGGCGAATNSTYMATIRFADFVPAIDPSADILIALRIRPVYAGAQLVVVPAQTLPYQANRIESVGTTQSGINRKIVVYQQYRSAGTLFDHAVYSEGSFLR